MGGFRRSLGSTWTVLIAATVMIVCALQATGNAHAATPVAVHVSGTNLVNAAGAPLRLLGVDKAGSEYACVQGWGIFDGPTDNATIAAMASWHVNAVRVPLNEDCWLGINGVSSTFGGAAYRSAIQDFVTRLNAAGMVAILDLHWSAPGTTPATGQQVMADADHSPAFWRSVAATFLGAPGVVFDLYNEPHDITWSCWRDGCVTPAGWRAAGMQQLLDAVRGTGATQPVMVGGLNWAGDLSQWAAYLPSDPQHQLVASAHIYNFSQCNTSSCWDATIGKVAGKVPVVTGEIGENDCAGGFTSSYMAWADAHGVSYLGWTWNTFDCASGPALIANNDGTPTAFGSVFKAHLAQLAASPTTPTCVVQRQLLYGFDGSSAPWHAEAAGTTLTAVSTPRVQGTGSMRIVRAVASQQTLLRVNDGGQHPVKGSAGDTLVGWVFVPATSDATVRWQAVLQLQDAAWGWHSGTTVQLTPGRWARVTITPSAALWQGSRAVGVQLTASTASTTQATAYLDNVALRHPVCS